MPLNELRKLSSSASGSRPHRPQPTAPAGESGIEQPLSGVFHLLSDDFLGRLEVAALAVDPRERLEIRVAYEVVGAEELPVDPQGLLVELEGLIQVSSRLPLGVVGELAEALGINGMPISLGLAADLQGLAKQGLGLNGYAIGLGGCDGVEVLQARREVGVALAERPRADLPRLRIEVAHMLPSRVIFPARVDGDLLVVRQAVEGRGVLGVVGADDLLRSSRRLA